MKKRKNKENKLYMEDYWDNNIPTLIELPKYLKSDSKNQTEVSVLYVTYKEDPDILMNMTTKDISSKDPSYFDNYTIQQKESFDVDSSVGMIAAKIGMMFQLYKEQNSGDDQSELIELIKPVVKDLEVAVNLSTRGIVDALEMVSIPKTGLVLMPSMANNQLSKLLTKTKALNKLFPNSKYYIEYY